MKYRTHPRTGDLISEIGFGSSYISEANEKRGVAALERAFEGGVNYYDMAAASSRCFPYYGKAFAGIRNKIFYQIHFGADYATGTYGWSTNVDKIRRSVEWQLQCLKTDYIDYGFIHCLDEEEDWRAYQKSGAFSYLMQLKEQGIVRHIGLSSHTPSTIRRVLEEAPVDMLMFSINPAYDYQKGEYAHGSVEERQEIYRRCETKGIGISVMKPFSGGQLLDAALSPFGKALTPYQCLQYALDRPGVLTVLPGMSSTEDVEHILGYYDASDQARDYAVISTFTPADAAGTCVYCNHCQPCPKQIDIGIINKYYDLAKQGDTMAITHYKTLSTRADACIACGHCNRRCPFGVDQISRMKEIAAYFATK